MGTALLAVALVWSIVLALLLADHVQRREAWYVALDAWCGTAPKQDEP
jgi:hypothetical protein